MAVLAELSLRSINRGFEVNPQATWLVRSDVGYAAPARQPDQEAEPAR
jgi:hypothetical protein